MGVPNSDLQDLERQRLQLEGNIRKLEESLYHWRTWEAEYDGLVEEIGALHDNATTDELLDAGRELDGSLVTEDEVKTILGINDGATRTRQQAVDIITRRIDYVKQNVATMEKRLRTEENKLQGLNAIEQIPTEPNADFAMTEIFEELDDDGNVISSSTTTPGDEASGLLDLLKKAGVNDIPEAPGVKTDEAEGAGQTTETPAASTTTSTPLPDAAQQPRVSDQNDQPMQDATKSREVPVTDVDESPEDAQLRREMLRYGLDEVGAVVAELELDEEGSEVSVDEYDDVYEYEDEDEEEDEFGRTTHSVLDEDYHRQMRELEAKLNARGMWNMGKDTTTLPNEVQEELAKPSIVRVEQSTDPTDLPAEQPAKEKKPKKKVAFSDVLDIAPTQRPTAPKKEVVPVRQSETPVVSDAVMERSERSESDKASSSKDAPKRASRFKASRGVTESSTSQASVLTLSEERRQPIELRSALRKPTASPSPSSLPLFPAKPSEPKPFSQPISDISDALPAPTGPEGKILADQLVEREPTVGAAPPEPDELDEQLHRKEIASDFYRMRNRMVQQNGGFLEEPETVPIETEEAPRRVSKFRAARMR